MGGGEQALARQGIVLSVAIGVDNYTATSLRAQGLNVPNPVPCQALLDTGASCLCIDSSIAKQLGLARRGIPSHTAAGPRMSSLYAVSLLFPGTNLKTYDLLRAAEVNLALQSFKCLIGRDVLSHWHFHYNGQSGAVSISD